MDHNYIISDHSIVHVYTDHVVNSFQVKLSRGKLDFTEISNLLVEKDWKYSSTDINVVTNAFFDNLISTLDTVSPLRETKIKLNNKWMNDDCREAIKNKNNAYKKYSWKSNEDWVTYKKCRNLLTKTIDNSKKIFYNNAIDKNKNNSKLMWSNLKDIMGDKKQKICGIICDDTYYHRPSDITNVLNNYYVEKC